jgi:hypothetical protein
MEAFTNMGMRMLTERDVTRLKGMDSVEQLTKAETEGISQPLPERVFPETAPPPELVEEPIAIKSNEEEILAKLTALEAPTQVPLGTPEPFNGIYAPTTPQAFNGIYAPTSPQGSPVFTPRSPEESQQYVPTSPQGSPVFTPRSPEESPRYAPTSPQGSPRFMPRSPGESPRYAPVSPLQGNQVTLDGAAPVINIDTSPAALQREGLSASATASAPGPSASPTTLNAAKPRRRFNPRPPPQALPQVQETNLPIIQQVQQVQSQPQEAQEVFGQGSPAAAAAMDETPLVQLGGFDTPQPQPASGPLTVIKLG